MVLRVVINRCRIELLGGVRIVQGKQTVSRFRTQKTAWLLAYLALRPDRGHPREELIDLFWPELPPEDGRNNLSTALSSLRRQLEPTGVSPESVLQADRLQVRLNPDAVSTDVAEFEQLLREAQAEEGAERKRLLERVLALYVGPLLPGCYEEWALQEQTRLSELHLSALLQYGRVLEAERNWDAALEAATRAAAEDACNEQAQRMKMRALAASGRISAALEAYEVFSQRLERELGVAPGPRTQKLAAQIRSDPSAILAPITREAGRNQPAAAPPPPAPLPAPITPFFGREPELDRILALLAAELDGGRKTEDGPRSVRHPSSVTRLITLTGPGGVGKTRLAIEAARAVQRSSGWTAHYVSLGDLLETDRVWDALSAALRLPPSADSDPQERVLSALCTGPVLLVLDNFEQLLDLPEPAAGADPPVRVVRLLLERCPELRILVTSRQVLNLEGEQEVPVPPLSTPRRVGTPERLLEFASVQLFLDRARSRRPDFEITPAIAGSVASLCERLEGIPLAIELAASWIKTLTPAEILALLDRRFELLVSDRADVAPRHRSLQAAVEGSYRMLPAPLQRLVARLSVFRGGWTAESAAVVCGNGDTGDVRRGLMQLQDRSLVVAEPEPDAGLQMRYRFLETIREYTARCLEQDEAEEITRQHAIYFLDLVERARERLHYPDLSSWRQRIEEEYENLRAALSWCLSGRHLESGLRLASAMGPFWRMTGHVSEGREWLSGFLQAPEGAGEPSTSDLGSVETQHVRARALLAAGILAAYQDDHATATHCYQAALELYRGLRDAPGIAAVCSEYYQVMAREHHYEQASELLNESLGVCRQAGHSVGIADALRCQANIERNLGRRRDAEALYEESMALYRRSGNLYGLSVLLQDYGFLRAIERDHARAIALYQESLDLCERLKDRAGAAHLLWLLGEVEGAMGDPDRSIELYRKSLQELKETGGRQDLIWVLGSLGAALLRRSEYVAAVQVLQERLQAAGDPTDPRAEIQTYGWLAAAATGQGDTSAARRCLERRLMVARTLDEVDETLVCLSDLALWLLSQNLPNEARHHVHEAVSLAGRAHEARPAHLAVLAAAVLAADERRAPDAVRLLAASDPSVFRTSQCLETPWRLGCKQRIETLKAVLGETYYCDLFAEGAAMPLADALARAAEVLMMP